MGPGARGGRGGRSSDGAFAVPVVAVGFAAVGLSRARCQSPRARSVSVVVVIVFVLVLVVVMVMGGRSGGRGTSSGDSISRRSSGTSTLTVPETHGHWFSIMVHDRTPTWDAGGLPVIAVRLAAVRLGRGRGEGFGLTQGGGNESQEDGGVCNGLHFDFAGCGGRVYRERMDESGSVPWEWDRRA